MFALLYKCIRDQTQNMFSLLLSYSFAGLCHETFHLVAFLAVTSEWTLESVEWKSFLMNAIFGRFCELKSLESANNWQIYLVRHTGWICSCLFAAAMTKFSREQRRRTRASTAPGHVTSLYSQLQIAAVVTALEAIATDLLGIGLVYGTYPRTLLYCGNFGIILLGPVWHQKHQGGMKIAMDLLETMTRITMMRGAQSGGIVAWTNTNKSEDSQAARCRLVAGKRSDLSRDLIRKLKKSNLRSARLFVGHTRFATTSMSDLDGTHPHRWTPPSSRRVISFELHSKNRLDSDHSSFLSPREVKVENYITHNGDLDFFKIHGEDMPLDELQQWLEKVTGVPLPATVDSVAIAGLVDILRTQGCFGLSLRYATLLACPVFSKKQENYPSYVEYDALGRIFEDELRRFCEIRYCVPSDIKTNNELRNAFKHQVASVLTHSSSDGCEIPIVFQATFHSDEECSIGKWQVVSTAIDAFFDNDSFRATKLFLRDAVGSFGIAVSCSQDSHRQICIAARGQPMSVAFYPDLGLVCYGSELAAVKAGLKCPDVLLRKNSDVLQEDTSSHLSLHTNVDIARQTCRYDLDDLEGEVVLLDWGGKRSESDPMVTFTSYQECSYDGLGSALRMRVTSLKDNDLLLPLPDESADPVMDDILDIPRVIESIRMEWREAGPNRAAAWNLGRCLRKRLQGRLDGTIPMHGGTVDILVTGCEVSLWVGEQFATDLQKAFPKLAIKAISSNKLLGVFGQELAVPAVGFPVANDTPDLQDTLVIIVSQSGGTFAPLATANLLQSVTKNIFVVTSEWDTQIGKQLRKMYDFSADVVSSRIFSTNVGVRPAEPCSLTVAATHQLLTQIYQHISLVILADQKYRHLSGAVVTERDLSILERCNRDNILALECIVGCQPGNVMSRTESELRAAGKVWANHVLEVAKAYILSLVYIIATVTFGCPLISGLAITFSLDLNSIFYAVRFLDSLIYCFLPQINILLIRLWEGRNLRHRMVGRTVVIGDIPWVSQATEAFLSKIFARSYSLASLNVLSGNPVDHLVHRHTHRVVRGTLLACGRPDGRLAALTSSDCAVSLAVNQASSIQSIRGTCESITIGHNPSPLTLTKTDIFLGSFRPKFLCERLTTRRDSVAMMRRDSLISKTTGVRGTRSRGLRVKEGPSAFWETFMCWKRKFVDFEVEVPTRSSHSLKGLYASLLRETPHNTDANPTRRHLPSEIVQDTVKDALLDKIFHETCQSKGGMILEEFVKAFGDESAGVTPDVLKEIFEEADTINSGFLDASEFKYATRISKVNLLRNYQAKSRRDLRGYLLIDASEEEYFGQDAISKGSVSSEYELSQSQRFSMEIYESRIASLQRYVSFCVMFHEMGKEVQDFFPRISCGFLGYRMDRTHSIMRIATTASPVSGDAVRERMKILRSEARYKNSVRIISGAWCRYQYQRRLSVREYADMKSTGIGHGLKALESSIQKSVNRLQAVDQEVATSSSYHQLKEPSELFPCDSPLLTRFPESFGSNDTVVPIDRHHGSSFV